MFLQIILECLNVLSIHSYCGKITTKKETLFLHHENNISEDIAQKLQIANDGLSRGVLTVTIGECYGI